ncbi:MAG TPA: hypothetical protein EYH18_03845 [Aquifex sp.]|nr:hypothetical protein [Aquifex sp.]
MILAKFEEDLLSFRNVVFNLPPNLSGEILYNFLDRSVFLLHRCGELLRLVTTEDKPKELNGEIVSAVFEALFTVKTFYDKVEKQTPLFLDQITLFFEPLKDKLDQLVGTFHSALYLEENKIDFEEMAYIIEGLSQTVEILIEGIKKIEDKIL